MGPGGTMKAEGKKINRTQFVVLGGLSVVAASIGFRMLSSGPQSAPAASISPAGGPAALPSPPTQVAVVPVMSITWPAAMSRDPFNSELVFPPAPPPPAPAPPPKVEAPVVAPAPSPPPPVDFAALAREKIHLKGTVLGERPLAMMNGRVYRVGEVVEGFKIVEIVTNQITVERSGTRVVLKTN